MQFGLLSRLCNHCRHSVVGGPMTLLNGRMQFTRLRLTCEPFVGLIEPIRLAGHSHWQNIKHIKGAKDLEKWKASNAIVHRIRVAVREGNSTNPKLNSQLARALDEGKSKGVPQATMMAALQRLEKSKNLKGAQLFTEGQGLGRSWVIVESCTDRTVHTRQKVQHVLKKYGGMVMTNGAVAHNFQFKGVVYVPIESEAETENLSHDQALELAIEAGAEEVVEGLDEDETPTYKFICEPTEVHSVKKALEDLGINPSSAKRAYLPLVSTPLNSEGLEKASKMLDELEALEDVVCVYHTIAPAEQ